MKHVYLLLLIAIAGTSCQKAAQNKDVKTPVIYNHVVILGNSITYTPANPSLGWNGSWGMAASVADSDYVHLLTTHFKSVNNSATLVAVNIVPFELNFDTYDFDTNLKQYKDSKPDLLIVRIGENVTTTDSVQFEKRYIDLLNYFRSNNPNLTILAVGSVWGARDLANSVMKNNSEYFISLISLQDDQSNFAYGLFANPAIQVHPDDKGMRVISNKIWAAVQTLRPTK